MEHGADATPEVGVDELAGTFPAEVLVVQGVVAIQQVQEVGQFPRGRKLFHVYEGMVRGRSEIVLDLGAHRDR